MKIQRITNATDGTLHQAYSYKDALGNFHGIFRNDLVKNSGTWALQNIDDNAYFYGNPLSSKISSILDYTGSQLGYKANSGTYAYDANGNTTYDPAIKLTTLYNYLNLPSKFTKDNGSKQELVYDFSGRKWQEKEYLADGNIIGLKSYLGSFEFEGNKLSRVFHGNGFIENKDKDISVSGLERGSIEAENIISTQTLGEGIKTEYQAEKSINLLPGFDSKTLFSAEIKPFAGYQWNYILRDHLGNTRILFADKNNDGLIKQDASEALNEVLSVSNYSPFGLELGGSHQNLKHQFDYKFNGKEVDSFSSYLDYGGRWFDQNRIVWGQIDPLGESTTDFSLLHFSSNNPINKVDPSGLKAESSQSGIYYDWDEKTYKNKETGESSNYNAAISNRNTTTSRSNQNAACECGCPEKPPCKNGDKALMAGALTFAATSATVDGPLPIGDAVGIIALLGTGAYVYGPAAVKAINEKLNPSNFWYVTYTKTSLDGRLVYVGRSSGFNSPFQAVANRDRSHNMPGFGAAVLSTAAQSLKLGGFITRFDDPAYWMIRGSEQIQIQMYRSEGRSANKINGIGITNRDLAKFMEFGRKFLP